MNLREKVFTKQELLEDLAGLTSIVKKDYKGFAGEKRSDFLDMLCEDIAKVLKSNGLSANVFYESAYKDTLNARRIGISIPAKLGKLGFFTIASLYVGITDESNYVEDGVGKVISDIEFSFAKEDTSFAKGVKKLIIDAFKSLLKGRFYMVFFD